MTTPRHTSEALIGDVMDQTLVPLFCLGKLAHRQNHCPIAAPRLVADLIHSHIRSHICIEQIDERPLYHWFF